MLSIVILGLHTKQHTGDVFTKFNHKVAWMRSLVTRAKRLCSPNKLKQEMKNIHKFASYNGFPKWIVDSTMKKANQQKMLNDEEEEYISLCLALPYIGNASEQIIKRFKKKLRRFLIEKVRINVFFKSTKLCFFTSN